MPSGRSRPGALELDISRERQQACALQTRALECGSLLPPGFGEACFALRDDGLPTQERHRDIDSKTPGTSKTRFPQQPAIPWVPEHAEHFVTAGKFLAREDQNQLAWSRGLYFDVSFIPYVDFSFTKSIFIQRSPPFLFTRGAFDRQPVLSSPGRWHLEKRPAARDALFHQKEVKMGSLGLVAVDDEP